MYTNDNYSVERQYVQRRQTKLRFPECNTRRLQEFRGLWQADEIPDALHIAANTCGGPQLLSIPAS